MVGGTKLTPRIFVILPFILSLNIAIPIVNIYSPWSTGYTSPASTALNQALVISAAGCTPVAPTTGAYTCITGPSLAGGTTSIFGSIVSTILVFGNWMQAANFLVQLAGGVVVPFFYIVSWLGGSNFASAVLVAGLYQALVWYSYGMGIIYLISGRFLEER